MSEAKKIFISYSHQDQQFAEELIKHLSGLRRQGLVEDYYDKRILPGVEWDDDIKSHLEHSHLILFLLSSDFMASDYINDIEIKKALVRHAKGEVKIVPVLVRDCDYTSLSLSKLQLLPSNARPVKSSAWFDRDEAWKNVVDGLKKLIEKHEVEPLSIVDDRISHPEIIPKSNRNRGCTFQILISICVLGVVSIMTVLTINRSDMADNDIVRKLDTQNIVKADAVKNYSGPIPGIGDTSRPIVAKPALDEIEQIQVTKSPNKGDKNDTAHNIIEVEIMRGLVGRRFADTPSFRGEFNSNGLIAIDIKVDIDGVVKDAVYYPGDSTSRRTSLLAQIAISKALQIKFDSSSETSEGTLLFRFKSADVREFRP